MRVVAALAGAAFVSAGSLDAVADEPAALVRERSLFDRDDAPLLDLDPVWRPALAFDAPLTTVGSSYARGSLRLSVEASQWSHDNGLVGDGWGAAARLSGELGPLAVGGYASYQELDTTLGKGAYVDLGVSVGRTWRVSKWTTVSLALTLGQRTWTTAPPPGEANATSLMFSIRGTFR